MKKLLISSIVISIFASCKAVKPYERQYVSDSEMKMENDTGKSFNLYVQSIREGATPSGSTKGSGGCGCN